MHFSSSVKIAATPAVIYELYAGVSEWPAWDSEVERAEISGPFAAGTLGMLKPRGGPQSKIELVEVTPGKSFSVRSKLPLCEMVLVMSSSRQGRSRQQRTASPSRVHFRWFLAF